MFWRPLGLLGLVCALASCARAAPVDVRLGPEPGADAIVAWAPRFVDVRHSRHGWQRIPLSVSAEDMREIEEGRDIRLATTHLPRGRYTAIRVGYLTPTHGRTTTGIRRTSRALDSLQLEERQLVLLEAFCVDGREDVLTLTVARPRSAGDAPDLRTAQTPQC